MPRPDEHFERVCAFVIKLAVCAHRWGTQARRLETYLTHVTAALGCRGTFRVTPTKLVSTFSRASDDPQPTTQTVHLPGTGFDLAKLARLGELVAAVETGHVALPKANARLDAIVHAPPPYGKVLVAAGYFLAGAGFAGFVRCGTQDLLLSGLLGMLVYGMVLGTEKLPACFTYGVPFLCTCCVGIIATMFSLAAPQTQVYLVTLSAVIYLVPGFTISCGVMELTYNYVHSGIINLVNGLLSLVLLFAGAWVGVTLVRQCFPVVVGPGICGSAQLVWPAAIIMAAGLCVIFQTPRRDFLWALAGCVIAGAGIILGTHMVNVNLGNFLGTVFVVVFANHWSGKTRRPASLVLLPAIVFLVSGSIGFRGFVALAAGQAALGWQEIAHMFVVALSIAAGLFAGNTLYRPNTSL